MESDADKRNLLEESRGSPDLRMEVDRTRPGNVTYPDRLLWKSSAEKGNADNDIALNERRMMERRNFIRTAVATGVAAGLGAVPIGNAEASAQGKTPEKYRAGIIGLGWTGLLYDLAERISDRFDVDDAKRPTPKLDIHRKFHHHTHPGNEGNPTSYAEALWDRPEVDLVAGADRDESRVKAFGDRYGLQGLYTDGIEMLRKENLDIVAICTNTKGRAFLTVKSVEHGAKAIFTEKPMVHSLDEADRMVKACADRGIPLSCGAITTTHPSFENAKGLVQDGNIGEIVSIEAPAPLAQHQNWSYFLSGAPAWVVGTGGSPRREGGSDEFTGQGLLVTDKGETVHFRGPSPTTLCLIGTGGEITFGYRDGWRLWQDVDRPSGGKRRVEMPWPDPQFLPPYGGIYSLDDVIRCLEGTLDEPKNSGRRVAVALEVEIAMKQSAKEDGARVELPLKDRSLRLNYDWFR